MSETPKDSPTTQSDQSVSSASKFAQRNKERTEGKILELSDGLFALVRRPSVNKLIASGHVPSDVAGVLMSGNASGALKGTKEFSKLVELQQIVARHALVKPKVVEDGVKPDYDNDEIAIDDLMDDDLSKILLYVQSGVTDLAKFRSE